MVSWTMVSWNWQCVQGRGSRDCAIHKFTAEVRFYLISKKSQAIVEQTICTLYTFDNLSAWRWVNKQAISSEVWNFRSASGCTRSLLRRRSTSNWMRIYLWDSHRDENKIFHFTAEPRMKANAGDVATIHRNLQYWCEKILAIELYLVLIGLNT